MTRTLILRRRATSISEDMRSLWKEVIALIGTSRWGSDQLMPSTKRNLTGQYNSADVTDNDNLGMALDCVGVIGT